MTRKATAQATKYFEEHLEELNETLYEGDTAKAFRHAAFQILAPDPNFSDEQVIEMTAIDGPGDLEIDGWVYDETSDVFFIFQAAGGKTPVNEAKVAKFWNAPDEVLNLERVQQSSNQSVKELHQELSKRLQEEDELTLHMTFASKAGFAKSAHSFAASRATSERTLRLPDESQSQYRVIFELKDQKQLSIAFDRFRAGFLRNNTDVVLNTKMGDSYIIETANHKSLRATVPASEILRVFEDYGFNLFTLNPRGPLANAKPNANIAKTLGSLEGRRNFHLLNNGLCATCEEFEVDEDNRVIAKQFQIVNGCQTTVTLAKRAQNNGGHTALNDTLIDLKLVVADESFAEEIASASNSQTALKAKDFTSFERQQKELVFEFGRLRPPWYYEIKQGYWRFVLSDKQKARFRTGRRKRHIEVQPLAQAALAFRDNPSIALDKVRVVFQGIRSDEDRYWYDLAFPSNVKAQQLLLPWILLRHILSRDLARKFSSFHILWLMATVLRRHYGVNVNNYFTPDLSSRLIDTQGEWINGMFRVANNTCNNAFRRAQSILQPTDLEARDFFRASGELSPGVEPRKLLLETFEDELSIEKDNDRDPTASLPALT